MKMTRFLAVSAVAVLIGMGAAPAQQAKPTENKGMTTDMLSGFDLGK